MYYRLIKLVLVIKYKYHNSENLEDYFKQLCVLLRNFSIDGFDYQM